ncbi:MATE family efflux transporter [Corticibacter populi]|uniref:MATE family efflux transporter n=2 Tax=Corticibacter populi TaxID=1550736 RepID=A0A3M6R0W7_9BURK|nr:MATE family efflux transporter [Corticibacter populi]
MAYSITDTIVAGRHSVEAQAALSVAAAVFISVYISLLAAIQALQPVWSELLGAGRTASVGASVRQSLYLLAAFSALGIALLLSARHLLGFFEVPRSLHADVARYLTILAAALPVALGYRVFSTLSQAIGMAHLVTWLQLAGLAIKIPLSILLTQGHGDWPGLGIAGCAWATLVVHVSLLVLALTLLLRHRRYQRLRLWRRPEAFDWPAQRHFMRLAIPAGLAAAVEITSFALMALLIARQGEVAASAHQIASNFAGIAYMFPLSLAIASSARVSYWRGAGREALAQRLARRCLGFSVLMSIAVAATLLVARGSLTAHYTDDAAVHALSSALLPWIGIYHLADSLQLMCIFLLRCWRVTLAPLLIYPVMLWGFGVAGGYWLAYHGLAGWPAQQAPWPFWAASALGLAITAALLTGLLRMVLRLHHPKGALAAG